MKSAKDRYTATIIIAPSVSPTPHVKTTYGDNIIPTMRTYRKLISFETNKMPPTFIIFILKGY
jgi:hypothetical protein